MMNNIDCDGFSKDQAAPVNQFAYKSPKFTRAESEIKSASCSLSFIGASPSRDLTHAEVQGTGSADRGIEKRQTGTGDGQDHRATPVNSRRSARRGPTEPPERDKPNFSKSVHLNVILFEIQCKMCTLIAFC
jgi:hypothetical protein